MAKDCDSKLFAPRTYWEATPEERGKHVNGCGPDGWKGKLVPDTLWGLKVTESCYIHDWMYDFGTTIDDKIVADRVFLNNMLRQIECGLSWGWLRRLRRRRARIYYEAVKRFGGPAFWDDKNPLDDFQEASRVVVA